MPAVVSDSSPLVYLARIDQFTLLKELYSKVLIPEAVWQEVAIDGSPRIESRMTAQAAAEGWLVQSPVRADNLLDHRLSKLGKGEQEAILLARQTSAVLIIDDGSGRKLALGFGIVCVGTLGVLIEAKLLGLVPALKPLLNRLQEETNFRFTEELFEFALRSAGET